MITKSKLELKDIFTDSEILRNNDILGSCNINGKGLEIGASYHPIAPKKLGYNIETLDHLSAEGLRNKYKNNSLVDINNIEEVDYVWTGLPLDETTGKENYYDYIIASHVIEHTPDMISFLQQCENMLNNNGVLALAVPDRRYCFDYFRPNSTTGEVIQAFLEKRKTHTPGVIFDHFSSSVNRGGVGCFGKSKEEFSLHYKTLGPALQKMKEAIDNDYYIDAHNWRFSSTSFELILHDLRFLNYTTLVESDYAKESGCEFIISLKKGEKAKSVNRLTLLKEIADESCTPKLGQLAKNYFHRLSSMF